MLAADPEAAARRAVGEARASLGDAPPSFAVLFASEHFFGNAQALVAAVAAETGQVPLIGCVAEAVAGGSREVESEPAVSLWLAAGLGPVETFAMEFVRTPSGGAFGGYRFEQAAGGMHLMVCDPFTFPVGDLLTHLNQHVPGATVMGGMASGGLRLRQSRCSSTAGCSPAARSAPACRRPRSIPWWRRAAVRWEIRTPPPAPTAM